MILIRDIGEHLRMTDADTMQFICTTVNTPDKGVALYAYKGRRYRWVYEGHGPAYWVPA